MMTVSQKSLLDGDAAITAYARTEQCILVSHSNGFHSNSNTNKNKIRKSEKTMKFNTEKTDDVTIIEIPVDSLDAGNVIEFKNGIAPILDRCDYVVFDMGRVKFIDSSGIGAILSCLRKLHSQDGALSMFGVKEQVLQLFKLVRIDRIITVHPTKTDAIKALQDALPGS